MRPIIPRIALPALPFARKMTRAGFIPCFGKVSDGMAGISGRSRRLQSAMEYLMTYGWAILIIAVVLGALFQLGVFNATNFAPRVPAGACQVERFATQVALAGECQGGLPQYVSVQPYTTSHGAYAPESSSLDTAWSGGSWTINAWYYGSFPANTATGRDLIEESNGCTSGLWVDNVSSSGYSIFSIMWYQTLPASGVCNNVGGYSSPSTAKVPFNTWVMVTAVFNYTVSGGTGNYLMTACEDGKCVNSTNTNTAPPEDYATWGYDLLFDDNDCCGGLIGGDLANVQMYNTSLSTSEIQALYLEGIGGAPVDVQSLAGWWPLNGNAQDYSGNGNNGQAGGGTTFTGSYLNGYTTP